MSGSVTSVLAMCILITTFLSNLQKETIVAKMATKIQQFYRAGSGHVRLSVV